MARQRVQKKYFVQGGSTQFAGRQGADRGRMIIFTYTIHSLAFEERPLPFASRGRTDPKERRVLVGQILFSLLSSNTNDVYHSSISHLHPLL